MHQKTNKYNLEHYCDSFMLKTYRYIQQSLKDLYPETEIRSFALHIFRHVAGVSLVDVFSTGSRVFSEKQSDEIREIVARLQKNEPLQYILGETNFYGLDFYVNLSTLIPRPETEELVEFVLQNTSPLLPYRILDIGTGSGCIAVALAKYLPKAHITGWDISEKALETAAKNAERNQVNVTFEKRDILLSEPKDIKEKYDIIVSNPPYVPKREKEYINKNVLEYEPASAIFVPDDDPLLFYKKISSLAPYLLKKEGLLFFETSSIFGKATADMLRETGFGNVELRKDMSGKDRMILGKVK